MNTASIGKTALTQLDKLQSGDRVIVTSDHPLFPIQPGTIWELPNSNAAIVEFDTGERELINLKHLKPAIAPQFHLHEGGLVEI
jgi:hypothetical protein